MNQKTMEAQQLIIKLFFIVSLLASKEDRWKEGLQPAAEVDKRSY